MKYKKYLVEAPSDKLNGEKFEKKFDDLKNHSMNDGADYPTLYKEWRELLRTTGITESQEYEIRLQIYKLFLKGFCDSIGGVTPKIKNFFDEITKTVKPVGSKGNGMEFGTSQLRFWSQFIEAYNWKEILNPDNVFKKVILWILQNDNGLNESLLINEAGPAFYISPEELERNPDFNKKIQQLQQMQQRETSDDSDNAETEKYIPKINNFKSFQDFYNLYVHHKLDEFDPDSPDPLGFMKNIRVEKSKNNQGRNDSDNGINYDDLSNNDLKIMYNSLVDAINKRQGLPSNLTGLK